MNSAREDKSNTEIMTQLPQLITELYEEVDIPTQQRNANVAIVSSHATSLLLVYGGRGGQAICTLASHQGEPGLISGRVTGFTQVGVVPMLLIGGFSQGSPVSTAPSFRQCFIFTSPSSLLKISLLRATKISSISYSLSMSLNSTVLCILESQVYVHWLRLQRVTSDTLCLAVWDSLRVSLQACYWLRGVQDACVLVSPLDAHLRSPLNVSSTARSLEIEQVAKKKAGIWKESALACGKEPSQRSLGVILGNRGKPKLGWPDWDSNPGSPECESSGLPLHHVAPFLTKRNQGLMYGRRVHASLVTSYLYRNCLCSTSVTQRKRDSGARWDAIRMMRLPGVAVKAERNKVDSTRVYNVARPHLKTNPFRQGRLLLSTDQILRSETQRARSFVVETLHQEDVQRWGRAIRRHTPRKLRRSIAITIVCEIVTQFMHSKFKWENDDRRKQQQPWGQLRCMALDNSARLIVSPKLTGPRCCRGHTTRLSHLGEPGSIPDGVTSGFSHVGIMPDDAAGRWVFLVIFRFSRSCIPAPLHSHITSSSSVPKISTLYSDYHLAAKDDKLHFVNSGYLKGEILPFTGAAEAEWLDCLPPTKAYRVQSPPESLLDFRK
ncbi:hypothetical protein PR048_024943 [Dryococelus australis]|uniref:Uncharacterized protein n=1 Tax=Dryococelus australis TaxID=614101 RepID=A0ABQ9GQ28_9NEOP|nr:hypothetical protein PR048_024943 [Dryococelus australis]